MEATLDMEMYNMVCNGRFTEAAVQRKETSDKLDGLVAEVAEVKRIVTNGLGTKVALTLQWLKWLTGIVSGFLLGAIAFFATLYLSGVFHR